MSEHEVASVVDGLIRQSHADDVELAPLTADDDFLRRVSLDLAGRIPSPREVSLFGLSPDPAKRAKKIDQLLESDGYAQIWAEYWTDVIFLRATEQRAVLARQTFVDWMQEQLADNRPWDEITTELLTATGDVNENGATALIFAHAGAPEELAAETSRIFLGIQLQCANCHDHPTDKWKREQFHNLAAYFPRIRVKRDLQARPPVFEIESADNLANARQRRPDPEQLFTALDRNRDGQISKVESGRMRQFAQRFDQLLERSDKDKDGRISLTEFKEGTVRPANVQPGRGSAEYYMPDLNDPTSEGKLMQASFFMADGKTPLPTGTNDLERRNTLARVITSKGNHWFAQAFVNRIWSEMMGAGFYTPIDDMGPERSPQLLPVLEFLADGFTANNYDVKWLLRVIANTETYQRQLNRTVDDFGPTNFAFAEPTRMRSDQIYNAIVDVLGIEDLARSRVGARQGGVYRFNNAPRRAFATLFGFDPSTPQADIMGNVPQALFMMNSPMMGTLIAGDRDTTLGRLLKRHTDNETAISELYLLVLSREPTVDENMIALEYIAKIDSRSEAFEDLMWALMNSSEFLTKR